MIAPRFRILLASALFLAFSALAAQGQPADKPKTEPAKPQGEPEVEYSYIEENRATQVIDNLREDVRNDVRRLHILVANYGAQVPNADKDFAEVKVSYRNGLDRYYSRKYAASAAALEKSHKQANDLFKKFATIYRDQLQKILSECSDAMVSQELSGVTDTAQQSTTSVTTLFKSSVKLKIAHGQLNFGDDMMRDQRYDAAIEHFRLAKLFAIHFLRSVESDMAKQKAIEDKYKVDLMDASGGSVSKGHK